MGSYVNYCLVLLEQRRTRFVALKAMGRAIVKVSLHLHSYLTDWKQCFHSTSLHFNGCAVPP